jgi:hypothetical protein
VLEARGLGGGVGRDAEPGGGDPREEEADDKTRAGDADRLPSLDADAGED